MTQVRSFSGTEVLGRLEVAYCTRYYTPYGLCTEVLRVVHMDTTHKVVSIVSELASKWALGSAPSR